jgi:hypothetical protein
MPWGISRTSTTPGTVSIRAESARAFEARIGEGLRTSGEPDAVGRHGQPRAWPQRGDLGDQALEALAQQWLAPGEADVGDAEALDRDP